MQSPDAISALILQEDNSIYFIGGAKPNSYHSSATYQYTDQWAPLATENTEILGPRANHCGFAFEGAIYVYGGEDDSVPKIYRNWVKFNVNLCSWEEYLQPTALARHSATCVFDSDSRKAIVFAGSTEAGVTSDVYLLRLNTATFELQQCSGETEPVFMHTSVLHQGNMYTYGGIKSDLCCTDRISCLSMGDWTWRGLGSFSMGNTPMRVSGHSSHVWKGKMLVYGGSDYESTVYSKMFVYDFECRWGEIEGSYTSACCGQIFGNEEVILLIGGINLLTKRINRNIQEVQNPVISWFDAS